MKIAAPLPLTLICGLMFGFGFLLVPIYDIFCEWTGLNGKTQGQYQQTTENVLVLDRKVTVQFLSNRNDNLHWPFKALEEMVEVNIGERRQVVFKVENVTDKQIIAQAVPSVSPSAAAPYLHKVECFCFQQQILEVGESKDMPLVFFVDPELPEHIRKLTLSYTLFDVTPENEGSAAKKVESMESNTPV